MELVIGEEGYVVLILRVGNQSIRLVRLIDDIANHLEVGDTNRATSSSLQQATTTLEAVTPYTTRLFNRRPPIPRAMFGPGPGLLGQRRTFKREKREMHSMVYEHNVVIVGWDLLQP